MATGEYSIEYETDAGYLLYVFAFYISVVVMLNLLIAIIGERFGIELEKTIQMDNIERSNLVLEIEGYLKLYRKLTNTDQEEEHYLHFARYKPKESQDNEPMDESEADVEGRMRIMSNQISRMKLFAEKNLARIIKDNDILD